jgi:predicted RecB family endonuclease
MNLIQIQEHLKDLPTQVVMSYANGQNPEVPPYMALGELNRRKTSEQRKTEPPTQSVKEKLESEVGGRGMPQGAPQAAPQGIAQLPAAQGAPQQMPQGAPQEMPPSAPPPPQGMPPGMAAGGVAGLPVRNDMFHYAPGGIVAFAGGELVRGPGGELVPDDDTSGEAEARAGMAAADQSQGPPASAIQPAGLQSLIAPATAAIAKAIRGESDEPLPTNPDIIRQEVLDKHPELATLVNTIPGAELAKLSEKLMAQNEASKAQFQDNQKRLNFGALGDALIAAGEATRGQKGIGAAFAGFGKSYSNYTAEDIKRQQAQQALERQQTIEVSKLNADIETLRQAYAKAIVDGDISAATTYKKQLAETIARRQTLQVGASEKAVTLANTETQTKGTLDHYKKLEENEALKLKEMISHNASQANIELQKLEVQKAIKNSQLALDRERLDALIESRPTAEQKVISRVEGNLNKPGSDFAEVTKRISGLTAEELDSPVGKYYRALRDKYRADAYKAAKLPVPETSVLPTYESFQPKPVEEPGFFSRMFGGSSAPAPKVIKLD